MDFIFYHIILGIIQGITEFIPISSSGHLVIAQNLFGLKEPQIFFDVVLHLGTLFAVVAYFRKDLVNIIRSIFKPKTEHFRLMLLLVVGTIPTAVLGFLLKGYFKLLFSSPVFPSIFLIFTGIALFLTKFKRHTAKGIRKFSFLDAIIIGIAQTVAIAPGISRSGITISTGIFRGIDRKLCAKYSLLLSIPAILGALGSEIGEIKTLNSIDIMPILLGFITAFIVGYAAIAILIKFLEKGKFHLFSYYCLLIGVISLLYFFLY